MNIALLGYGKMGKEIEAIALQRHHTIALVVDSGNSTSFNPDDLKQIDVAIEFSTPHTAVQNIKLCFEAHVPVVVGTTGWYTSFSEIEKECLSKNATLFHATNFSLGVNLFFKLNSYLAELMNKYEEYNVEMEEIHHIHKRDRPSGTAISLANRIIEKIDRKTEWSLTEKSAPNIWIKDVRESEVPGTHTVKYTSAVDDIEIKHIAHNRKGFALGAVVAAEYSFNKKGIFTMKDII